MVTTVGIGRVSCATWLKTPASEAEGSAWILGFWTGFNYSAALTAENSSVGAGTDGLGIIGAMKKRCAENPAGSLTTEAARLYIEFRNTGK